MATALFTIPETAKYFGVSRQRIWLLVTQGRIKARRVGQSWLIAERDMLKLEWKRAGRPRGPRKPTRYCVGCKASLTDTDYSAKECTQCHKSLN